MKFSTKARYGLRVMMELAIEYNKNLIQLKEIAEREDIPEKYLEQIIIALRSANLVKSVRGARGGYFLDRKPEDITVREIIEKLEGSLYPVDCGENPKICKRSSKCVTVDIWKKIGDEINKVLEGITLRDLVNSHEEKNKSAMFYI